MDANGLGAAPDTPNLATDTVAADPGTTEVESAPAEVEMSSPIDEAGASDASAETSLASSPEESPFDWGAWDGKVDGIDEQYHGMHARMTALHGDAVTQLQADHTKAMADADEMMHSLLMGDTSLAQANFDKQLKTAQDALAEQTAAATEWEQKYNEAVQQAQAVAAQSDASTMADFEQYHGWVFEDSTPQATRDAIASLLDAGVHPFAAATMAKEKPKYFEAYAAARKAGANHEFAAAHADKAAAPVKPTPPPQPSAAATLAAGRAHNRGVTRQRTMADAGTVAQARDVISARLAKQLGR